MSKSLGISAVLVVFTMACGGGEESDSGGGASASAGAAGVGGTQAGGTGGTGGTGGVVEPAKMVQLPAGFWIDSTEVTRAQYEAWLEKNPSAGAQPEECSWNTDFTPGCHWPPGEEPNHPVSCVDWCDAYAYCQGVGKRLCGKIGGGPAALEDRDDATRSQWYYACSSGGLYEYPYGNDYDPSACNLEDSGLTSTAPVGSFPACQSSENGFGSVFDLCGNLAEWVDACNASKGSDDQCNHHDGSFAFSAVGARCRLAGPSSRSERAGGLGFRCCRDQ